MRKIKAWVTYIGVILIKILAWPYSLVVYPIAYYFRHEARVNRCIWIYWMLWIVLDDENDYGEPWWLIQNKLKENFFTAWRWSWARNNSWNLNQVLKIPIMREAVISGYDTSKLNNPLYHCRFKWEIKTTDGWIDGWDINQGERLSQKYTNMGKAFCWYEDKLEWKYDPLFRGSYAGIKWGYMINYKYGFNDRGEALVDLKIKKFKDYYTAHWV